MRELHDRGRIRQEPPFCAPRSQRDRPTGCPNPSLNALVHPKTAHVENPGGPNPLGNMARHHPGRVAARMKKTDRTVSVQAPADTPPAQDIVPSGNHGKTAVVPKGDPFDTSFLQLFREGAHTGALSQAGHLLERNETHPGYPRSASPHTYGSTWELPSGSRAPE